MEDLSKKVTLCRDLNEVQKRTMQRFERGAPISNRKKS